MSEVKKNLYEEIMGTEISTATLQDWIDRSAKAGDYIRTMLEGSKPATTTVVQDYIAENNLQPVIDRNKPNIWDDLVKESKYPQSAEIPLGPSEPGPVFDSFGKGLGVYGYPNISFGQFDTERYDYAAGMKIANTAYSREAFYNEADTGGFIDSCTTPDNPDYLFDEGKFLIEAKAHIDKTYSGHYSGQYQATSIIIDAGHGTGFNIGNIIKYAKRYGKKDGYNKADLMKIIHYAIMQMHVHDKENLS